MSEVKRVFLGWKKSGIQSSAEILLNRYRSGDLVDMTSVTVVVPTGRVGRRLREVLLKNAAAQQLGIFPPRIETIGQLPELLYSAKQPFAPSLVQQFAWVEALRKASRGTLRHIVPTPPDEHDPRWMELGSLLQRQHIELTDHRLDFAAVAERGKSLEGFTDAARWTSLAEVQASYLALLDDLQLWDRQTARNVAIENRECSLEGDLILIGMVDLSRTLRGMLEQLGEQVTSLVFAEPSIADRFDEFGCVRPEAWQSVNVGVEEHHILIADGPANQADAVVYAIESLEGEYGADDITIGVPDSSLVPHLENRLGQFDIRARWGPGRPLSASPPAQWLRIVADYLESDRYAPFAELLRHSDTRHYLDGLQAFGDPARAMDEAFRKHLPDYIRDDGSTPQDYPDAVSFLFSLLKDLRGAPQSPKAWASVIFDVVERLYYQRTLDKERDRATLEAYNRLSETARRFEELPEGLTPKVSASVAILMLLSHLDDAQVPPAAGGQAIEMVGWLDVPLDDAAVAIITNMNDGVVPKSVSSDVFLPNRFREALGLDDNAMRYARDAYALQATLNSRMIVRLVVGRRAETNDPLRPSRLLMATQREKLAERCLMLFNEEEIQPIVQRVDHDQLRFHVPRPEKLVEPITALSVTAFGRYLTCPYRFYLSRVQGLKARDDRMTELDGATFGQLAHDALEAFGRSEFRDSSDADEISLYLRSELSKLAKQRFGAQPMATIQIQLAQLRLRLEQFALKQAAWRSEGWEIVHTELEENDGVINVDGEPFRLLGRIDRIDRRVTNSGCEEFAILDYKTGDAGEAPEKKHISKPGKNDPLAPAHWVDLQLPLYRYLVRSVDGLGPDLTGKTVKLGYVLLPGVVADTRFEIAEWSDSDLMIADEAACDVVRKIRNEVFWPPTDPIRYQNTDEFSAVVQHGVFGRAPFVTEEEIGS